MRKQRLKKSEPSESMKKKDASIPGKEVVARVFDLIVPVCDAEGIELVHVEYQREAGGRILRVYIDKPGGITLADCTMISRQINTLLDVHLDLKAPYNLEVSSPGPDRPLAKASDFNRFQGNRAKIRTHQFVDGQKNFTGVLLGLSDGKVWLKVEDKTVAIPYQGINRARLVDYRGENTC